jgi:hypothetical protein
MSRLLRTNELVGPYRSERRTKKANAFPKIFRSLSLRANSASSRAILASGVSTAGFFGAGPGRDFFASRLSAARTQFDTLVAARLNSRPKSAALRPCR